MPIRTSEGQWDGTLKDGKGRFWTGSGEVAGDFSFGTRFEEEHGTNPEELIGAALASCFSMALAADLETAGHPSTSVRTTARVDLERDGAGFTVKRIDLDAEVHVPDVDDDVFQRIASTTKDTCPISRAIAVPIGLQAHRAA
jgi:osmotically inducible protein OsmC